MAEIIRFNNADMVFEQSPEGKRKREWMLSPTTRLTWSSPLVATVHTRKAVFRINGDPIEGYFLNQDPEGKVSKYEGTTRVWRRHERDFLGRQMMICPEKGRLFPPELPEILDYVEENWRWRIDSKIRRLLVGFRPQS